MDSVPGRACNVGAAGVPLRVREYKSRGQRRESLAWTRENDVALRSEHTSNRSEDVETCLARCGEVAAELGDWN